MCDFEGKGRLNSRTQVPVGFMSEPVKGEKANLPCDG